MSVTPQVGLLVLILSLSACTFTDSSPDIPEVPPPPAPAPAAPAPPPPAQVTSIVYVEKPAPPPEPEPERTRTAKRPPADHPDTLVREAQAQAQVEPTRRGYFGQRNDHRFFWQPGRTFVVYVSPEQMTKITLPPGELLISQVFLNPEAWDVHSYRVGTEVVSQDVVFVRPLADKGAKDVDVSLLTESGHSFDVRLRVGTIGMTAVSFEVPRIEPVPVEDAPLRAP